MARWAGPAAVLVAAALVVLWQSGDVYDWAKFPRDQTTSSPTLSALFSREVVLLRDGQRACLEPVTFDAETGKARVRLRAPRAPAPTVDLEFRGDGHVARGRIPPLEPEAEGVPEVAIGPPAGREVTGEFCFHNRGPTPVQLIGTNEGRSLTPVNLRIDGRLKPDAELEVVLFKREPKALARRPGELVDRAAALTAGWVPVWLLWPIAVLMLLLPAIAVGVFAWSVWREERPVSRAPARPPSGDRS